MIKITPEINYIIELLKCAVTDEIPSVPPETIDWDRVFRFAKRHKICSTLFFGLQKLPKANQSQIKYFDYYRFAYQKNLVSDANRSYEISRLKPDFARCNIDYVFLKGSVTKYLYPDTSMRTMNDIDIFYRGAELSVVIDIFKKNGYEISRKEPKEICFLQKLNNIKIEMQTQLVDDGYEVWSGYLKNIWEKYLKVDNLGEYQMTHEDFYIYHIIHLAKHFKNGGIGLVHVLDTWVLRNAYKDMDFEYVKKELTHIGLSTFDERMQLLLACWFENYDADMPDAKTVEKMTRYFFANGAFGTKRQQETNHIIERNDTGLSIRKKIFPDQKTMVNYYGERLKKYPWLIPLYWIRLNFKRIFRNGKNTRKSFSSISKITEEKINETKDLMERCGLSS